MCILVVCPLAMMAIEPSIVSKTFKLTCKISVFFIIYSF